MRASSLTCLLLTSVLLWNVETASAGTRTYGFSGVITTIDNLSNLPVNDTLAVGTPYTVTYTFDDAVPSYYDYCGYYDYNTDTSTANRTFNMTLSVGNYTFNSVSGTYGNTGNITITDNLDYPWYDTYQIVGQGFTPSQGLNLNQIAGYVTGNYSSLSCTKATYLPPSAGSFAYSGLSASTQDYNFQSPTSGLAIEGNLNSFFTNFKNGNSYLFQTGPTFDVQCSSDIDYDNVITDNTATISTYSTASQSYNYNKGIMEFNLGYIPDDAKINSVTLTLDIASFTGGTVAKPVIQCSGYAGNGIQDSTDANAALNLIGQKEITDNGLVSITLDADYVKSLLGSTDYLGLNLLPGNRDHEADFFASEAFPNYGSAPLLTIDFSLTRVPGDANNDGAIDVGDLGILAANYGVKFDPSFDAWGLGDFNGDHVVDVGDLGILAANYGHLPVTPCAIPEPLSLALFAVGGLLLRRRR